MNITAKIIDFYRLARNSKRAQLGLIEAKFLIVGFLIGIVLALVFVFLANKGILGPIKMTFLCPK